MFKRVVDFLKQEAVFRTFHYYFLFISMGLGVGISGPTLPALAAQTNTRLGQMGFVFLLSSVGYTLGTILGGRLLDRLPGHRVLGVAQCCTAGLIFFLPVVPWFWVLLLIIMLKGVADGLINGVNTLLVWTHGDNAGPFINALHFFFGLGAFVSPLVVARLIANPDGYRWAYWGVGIFGMLVGLRLLFLPGSPKPEHSHNDGSGAPVRIFYPLVIGAMLYLFFYVGAEITFGGWLYTYTTTLNLLNASGAAYLTSGFWLAFTIGRLISIPLASHFKPQQVIPAALIGCLAISTLLYVFPPAPGLLWLVTVVLGLCMAPLWAMGYTFAGQSIKLTARLSAIILLGDSLGGMFLPWVVGQVIDLTGPQAVISLMVVSIFLCLLVFIFMLQMMKNNLVTT